VAQAQTNPMNASHFRRIALSLAGVEQGSHMGAVDFRVGGRIFATLASEKLGFGNLIISPKLQAELIRRTPALFLPVAGGWGRLGATHVRLAAATEADLKAALQTAWEYRVAKNSQARANKRRSSLPGRSITTAKAKSA
jgi:hypothetical protein